MRTGREGSLVRLFENHRSPGSIDAPVAPGESPRVPQSDTPRVTPSPRHQPREIALEWTTGGNSGPASGMGQGGQVGD